MFLVGYAGLCGGREGLFGFRVPYNIECRTGRNGRVCIFPVVLRFTWVVVVVYLVMYMNTVVLVVVSIFEMSVWLVFMSVTVCYVWHVFAGPRGRRAQPTHTHTHAGIYAYAYMPVLISTGHIMHREGTNSDNLIELMIVLIMVVITIFIILVIIVIIVTITVII